MSLLHIYDASDFRIRLMARSRGTTTLKVTSFTDLLTSLNAQVAAGARFERILFETHGSPGRIYFDDDGVSASTLRSMIPLGYNRLTTPSARVYFNGCNVAAESAGWSFLDAAVELFLTPGGGEVFGQTSLGIGNPFNGHVVHLWGETRRLFVDSTGRIVERFEQ
ncbi:DUF4347 domain-containing protein [Rhodanobacter sp. L36]|uniref:DUF4347 domain-containing protein n=1 Tax=Rhodanobacter sp. L36 TaxID=1747221 RepID=UPI00131B4FA5|nr:DUF4347 domain-containing protein [Rhodanobacter sp. L36]